MADMTKDIFAETAYGKAALLKFGPLPENFRLYAAEAVGTERDTIKVTGAEFRVAKRGKYKDKLSVHVKGTDKTTYVSRTELVAAVNSQKIII